MRKTLPQLKTKALKMTFKQELGVCGGIR